MKEIIANEKITASKVRLVHGAVNEVMDLEKALGYADSSDLDLVQISDTDVPVVKVLDLNKYCYELKQAQKINDKKQRTTATQIKEVQFSTDTQENDLSTKLKKTQEFISSGKQVKLVMKIIGRTNSNKDVLQKGISKMNQFVSRLQNADLLQDASLQGNNIVCIVKALK